MQLDCQRVYEGLYIIITNIKIKFLNHKHKCMNATAINLAKVCFFELKYAMQEIKTSVCSVMLDLEALH